MTSVIHLVDTAPPTATTTTITRASAIARTTKSSLRRGRGCRGWRSVDGDIHPVSISNIVTQGRGPGQSDRTAVKSSIATKFNSFRSDEIVTAPANLQILQEPMVGPEVTKMEMEKAGKKAKHLSRGKKTDSKKKASSYGN
ncbi:hypothetical protein F5H01DRAFT_364131 [Linnemannia elongata]|nr:hypothetical protein F5H01DRAFT_364131 [Linnemannia elongata]